MDLESILQKPDISRGILLELRCWRFMSTYADITMTVSDHTEIEVIDTGLREYDWRKINEKSVEKRLSI